MADDFTIEQLRERLAAAEALVVKLRQESQARLDPRINSWVQAVWETDAIGLVAVDSPSWREYTGQTVEEWLGYGWLDAIHPDDRAYAERQWREAMAAQTLVNADFRLRAPDGGWRWTNVRTTPLFDTEGNIEKWAGINIDIHARTRTEAALRESEERQAFLLKLSDALRPLADAAAIQNTATRLLAEYFGASHAFYIDVDGTPGDERATASGQYTSPGTTPWPPQFRLADFGPALIAEYRAGRPVVSPDLGTDPRIEPAVRRNYGAVDAAATIGVPLVKEGCWVASFGLVTPQPREWTGGDVALVQDVAERTWAAVERAHAEAALRRSEERLRALFESIGEGFSEMQVILDKEGHVVDWLHLALNANFSRVTGIPDITGRLATEVFPNLEGEWFKRMDVAYRTGEPQRFETELADLGRWFDNYIIRVGDGDDDRVLGVFSDITARKKAEAMLRESSGRQAFLLQLSDLLRGETDEEKVQQKALQMLAEHLQADRAYITTSDYEAGFTEVPAEVCRTGAPPLAGKFWHSDYPESSQAVNEGTMVIHDVGTDPDLSAINRQSFAGFGIGAVVGFGLRRGVSDIFWTLAVAMDKPRQWTPGDVLTLEQAAERAWTAMQRARAEAALRESEERFRQFGRASSDGLWIRDAETLRLEYASDAMESIYGISIEAMTAEPSAWPALIVPEDREETFAYIDRVKAGESVVHEFRIQRPNDLQFRWVRSVGFPLLDDKGVATRIAGISSDITEQKILAEHQGVLLHELQHRVRNIMGVIRSIGNRSADGASTVEEYRQTLEGRMLALARVQALLTREANAGGSLRDIIENEVKVQAHYPHQFELVGPDIMLAPKAVEVLTMAFHELSTNALKYGAFSVAEGRLSVSWSTFDKRGTSWLSIDWTEAGVPQREPSKRRGFGSELIEARIPYELGGMGRITIEPGGARCRMEFPIKDAESILETDAPMPTTTFGGTIDMSGAPDLTGRVVLVVEDDYYMAADTVAALRGAGAGVLGPCANEDAARDLLKTGLPTHAVLDLNLGGGGPKFEIAQMLKSMSIPFIFITGYDPDVIPQELAHIPRLQKPVSFRTIVEAVSLL